MDKSKNLSASPTPVSKSEKKEPLSLEELLAKKKAEELARSKVSALLIRLVDFACRVPNASFLWRLF